MNKTARYILIIAVLVTAGILSQVHCDIPVEELKKKYADKDSRFMEISGTQVHYRDQGRGPVLVLVHGTAASLHTWDAWTEELKNDFRIIRMDLPGFGLTGPRPDRDYSTGSYVSLIKELLGRVGADRCFMAGNSLGGAITWNYALAHPGQVRKIILIDAAGYPMDRTPYVFILARTPVLNSIMRWVTPRSVFRHNILEVYGDDSKVTEALLDRYYELTMREGNRQALIDRSREMTGYDPEKISKITTPALIMWGSDDKWITVSHAHNFKRDLKNSRLVIYQGAGHVPMEELPLHTARDAQKFLLY